MLSLKKTKNIALMGLFLIVAHGTGHADPMAGMRVYSGLSQAREGGYVGFQITIIPYSGGEKVLWRDQESDQLKAPILLDAVSTGMGWKVTVPGKTRPADWYLIQQSSFLQVQDPWGLHFQLKEMQLK
jgi:hypothetical protein